jgi:hypothetical protein
MNGEPAAYELWLKTIECQHEHRHEDDEVPERGSGWLWQWWPASLLVPGLGQRGNRAAVALSRAAFSLSGT